MLVLGVALHQRFQVLALDPAESKHASASAKLGLQATVGVAGLVGAAGTVGTLDLAEHMDGEGQVHLREDGLVGAGIWRVDTGLCQGLVAGRDGLTGSRRNGGHEVGRGLAVVQGNDDTAAGETHHVQHAVSIDVCQGARGGVVVGPASGCAKRSNPVDRRCKSIALVQSHHDAVGAESDDIGQSITVDVCDLARLGVAVGPGSSTDTKVTDPTDWGLEGGSRVDGHHHAGGAKAHDVG